MNKYIKTTLIVASTIILLIALDLICIFTLNRPIFAIKEDNGDSVNIIYKGILYNTYNCQEYAIPQIKGKRKKFNCVIEQKDIGSVVEIIDKTKKIKDFACAEALEQFYEDDNYIYYYNCIKGKYIIVKYETGYEETVESALKNGSITIKDLDNYNIDYIKYNK